MNNFYKLKMTKKQKYILLGGIVMLILFWIISSINVENSDIVVAVKKGRLNVEVVVTGELFAKSSEDISASVNLLRSVGIWSLKITDIIPEGTVVKEGDYVATLDRTEVMSKLKDNESEILKNEAKYLQTKLDTTLDLRNTRDELLNLKYAVEEKKIAFEQSQFEPPATIRQAQIEFDKAQRTYEQAIENFAIKKEQAIAKMQEVAASLNQEKRKYEILMELNNSLIINAPKGGMVIYNREWDGKKKVVGSTIGPWEPAVATLPDLSKMISKTYINEVDIRKIKKGQTVRLGLDAFPEKKLRGKVESVANVGEQNPNSESKVFEVDVLLDQYDSTLRPAMTTVNTIVVSSIDSVLIVPLECVHKSDTVNYVFQKTMFGVTKKIVTVGLANNNDIIIKEGLSENDNIYLSIPENANVTEPVTKEESSEK